MTTATVCVTFIDRHGVRNYRYWSWGIETELNAAFKHSRGCNFGMVQNFAENKCGFPTHLLCGYNLPNRKIDRNHWCWSKLCMIEDSTQIAEAWDFTAEQTKSVSSCRRRVFHKHWPAFICATIVNELSALSGKSSKDNKSVFRDAPCAKVELSLMPSDANLSTCSPQMSA